VLPGTDQLPTAHGVHVEEPGLLPKYPAGQGEQVGAPDLLLCIGSILNDKHCHTMMALCRVQPRIGKNAYVFTPCCCIINFGKIIENNL
jgi:hypothetical protein